MHFESRKRIFDSCNNFINALANLSKINSLCYYKKQSNFYGILMHTISIKLVSFFVISSSRLEKINVKLFFSCKKYEDLKSMANLIFNEINTEKLDAVGYENKLKSTLQCP